MSVSDNDNQKLLQFLYQVPVGIIEFDNSGSVGLMNPVATQELMSISPQSSLANLFDVLDTLDSNISKTSKAFEPDFGQVMVEHLISYTPECNDATRHLWLNINKLGKGLFIAILRDVTDYITKERQSVEAREKAALEKGKAEIASGMLHDIGNAITGLGSNISKQVAQTDWPEIENLNRLKGFVQEETPAIAQGLGEDKAKALNTFLDELSASFGKRKNEIQERFQKMSHSVGHISEILSINRRYTNEQGSGGRQPYHLIDLIEDAIGLQLQGFEKRNIRIDRDYEKNLPVLYVDKTKIIQVIINLMKNALESYDILDEEAKRQFCIEVFTDSKSVIAKFTDDAGGFEPDEAENFFQKDVSTKDRGSGIGLFQCLSIVKSHSGNLELSSPGLGMGASSILKLPIEKL